jgi:hypothetical protein
MIRIFSPDAQSHPVRLIEQKLGFPPNTAIVVPYEAMDGARAQYCFQNVRDVVAKIGGQIVNGWLVWQHDNIFVEAEHHAVWRKPTGEVVCITPQTPPEESITFIPDPPADYDFDTGRVSHNVRIALLNDSRLQQIFKACEQQTDLLNAKRWMTDRGPLVELSPSDSLNLSELENLKSDLMTEIVTSQFSKAGRNAPCPCGSGKKYKKCHGS